MLRVIKLLTLLTLLMPLVLQAAPFLVKNDTGQTLLYVPAKGIGCPAEVSGVKRIPSGAFELKTGTQMQIQYSQSGACKSGFTPVNLYQKNTAGALGKHMLALKVGFKSPETFYAIGYNTLGSDFQFLLNETQLVIKPLPEQGPFKIINKTPFEFRFGSGTSGCPAHVSGMIGGGRIMPNSVATVSYSENGSCERGYSLLDVGIKTPLNASVLNLTRFKIIYDGSAENFSLRGEPVFNKGNMFLYPSSFTQNKQYRLFFNLNSLKTALTITAKPINFITKIQKDGNGDVYRILSGYGASGKIVELNTTRVFSSRDGLVSLFNPITKYNNNLYVVLSYQYVKFSEDGGKSWKTIYRSSDSIDYDTNANKIQAFSILPHQLIVGTTSDGAYIFDKSGKQKIQQKLDEHYVTSVALLPSGEIALGTSTDGFYLMDINGKPPKPDRQFFDGELVTVLQPISKYKLAVGTGKEGIYIVNFKGNDRQFFDGSHIYNILLPSGSCKTGPVSIIFEAEDSEGPYFRESKDCGATWSKATLMSSSKTDALARSQWQQMYQRMREQGTGQILHGYFFY